MSETAKPLIRTSYGWVIVIVAALAMVATLPGRTHGLGMITERLLADPRFRLDRVSFATINLWATLLGGLFCLPCGWLIDRFGLRLSLCVTLGLLAVVVIGMTHITTPQLFALAILLTRGFGQSALSVISITMVGKWFPGKLSWPMAVYTLVMSLGFALAAQIAKHYASDDWRILWGGIGYVLLAGIPLAVVLTREPATTRDKNLEVPSGQQATGSTVAQAMRTQAFWLFGIAISLIALIGSGISLFNESILTQQGFPRETYYNLFTLTGTVGLICQLPVGWLGQRVPLNRLLTVGLLLQAICMGCLPLIRTQNGIIFYGVGMGIAGTITTVLFFTIWGQAYGQAHLGQIQSIAQMMTVLASAGGPRVFAEWFEQFGSYRGIFHALAALAAALACWSWWVPIPTPESADTDQVSRHAMIELQSALPESP